MDVKYWYDKAETNEQCFIEFYNGLKVAYGYISVVIDNFNPVSNIFRKILKMMC